MYFVPYFPAAASDMQSQRSLIPVQGGRHASTGFNESFEVYDIYCLLNI
jgi:hypothetical protein